MTLLTFCSDCRSKLPSNLDKSDHFRGNYWDLYAQDEWKMRANLTLDLGVRYEYVSPLTEINNRIANLDLSPGCAESARSGPGGGDADSAGASRALQRRLPASLVRPDRNNFAPRIGFAWKPFSKTVVRGGYGINYNTGAYQGIAQQLALQPPFATTATNIQTAAWRTLTLQSGFPTATGITNDYAVNPNYRLGYVQIRNLDIQQQIRPTLLLNIDYTGTKGTDLDILEAPNRTVDRNSDPGRSSLHLRKFSGGFGSQRGLGAAAQAVGERILDRRHLYIFEIAG